MTGMENRCMAIKDFSLFHLKTSTLNWCIFSCLFLKNIYNHTTKRGRLVFQIQYWYWKDIWKVKYWSQVQIVFLLLRRYFLFLLSCQKNLNKNGGCSLAMLAAHGHHFTRSAALLPFYHQFVALDCWCRNGGFPFRVHTETDTEEGPRRWEIEVFSRSCHSLHLFSLWCRSSLSLIGAVQWADSPRMADGGRGSGLLECWHVPIRATVLHYSISATQQQMIRTFNQAVSAPYWTVQDMTYCICQMCVAYQNPFAAAHFWSPPTA